MDFVNDNLNNDKPAALALKGKSCERRERVIQSPSLRMVYTG